MKQWSLFCDATVSIKFVVIIFRWVQHHPSMMRLLVVMEKNKIGVEQLTSVELEEAPETESEASWVISELVDWFVVIVKGKRKEREEGEGMWSDCKKLWSKKHWYLSKISPTGLFPVTDLARQRNQTSKQAMQSTSQRAILRKVMLIQGSGLTYKERPAESLVSNHFFW